MELNVFSASTNKTASVLFVPNMSCIKFTAASYPASCSPNSRKSPTAFVVLSLTILMITSLLFYDALLQNSISLMQIFLMKSAVALRRSDVQLPNTFDVNIFLHPSTSNPKRLDLPFVLITAFLTNCSFVLSKIIGWIAGGSPLISFSS